jgi:hypothetical protein
MCGIYNSTQLYCVNTNTVLYDWYNQKVNDNKYLELENIKCCHHLNTFLDIPPSILIRCKTKIKFTLKRPSVQSLSELFRYFKPKDKYTNIRVMYIKF